MVTIYVEGGGDEANLKSKCRRAFTELLSKAGYAGRMPKPLAMGTRHNAYRSFAHAHANAARDELIVLLVDSEDLPQSSSAWTHLKQQDNWTKPKGATEDQAHLMVACMETWLIADPDACADYFGQGFEAKRLPRTNLENRAKDEVYSALATATASAKPKGKYGKARDSFELLSRISPGKLRAACSWAERFFDVLDKHC